MVDTIHYVRMVERVVITNEEMEEGGERGGHKLGNAREGWTQQRKDEGGGQDSTREEGEEVVVATKERMDENGDWRGW